jgi:hypothetical protein
VSAPLSEADSRPPVDPDHRLTRLLAKMALYTLSAPGVEAMAHAEKCRERATGRAPELSLSGTANECADPRAHTRRCLVEAEQAGGA